MPKRTNHDSSENSNTNNTNMDNTNENTNNNTNNNTSNTNDTNTTNTNNNEDSNATNSTNNYTSLVTLFLRWCFFFVVFNSMLERNDNHHQTNTHHTNQNKNNHHNKPAHVVTNFGVPNLWKPGEEMTLVAYYSDSSNDFTDFQDQTKIIWIEPNLLYHPNAHSNNRQKTHVFHQPLSSTNGEKNSNTNVGSDGGPHLHVFLTLKGFSPNPNSTQHSQISTLYVKHKLTEEKTVRNFSAVGGEGIENTTILYWKRQVAVELVFDDTVYMHLNIPPQVEKHLKIVSRPHLAYFPVLRVNSFWLTQNDFVEVNETLEQVSVELSFKVQNLFSWQLYSQLDEVFETMGDSEMFRDISELKQVLLTTNPYLLGLTAVVSVLHALFDLLAFKNEIQFWRKQQTLAGISLRAVCFHIGCEIIIILYLLDNEESTSSLVLLSCVLNVLVDIWKMLKALTVQIQWGFPPRIQISEHEQYIQSNTSKYDKEAMFYVSLVMFPLVCGYSVYSWIYHTHKRGVYSWLLSSLVGAVYTFGFVMMTPQIWINYRLKSVRHLNWRALTYRALNTFIDDLFAFIMPMPTMHRLSCFRDDIVFFIFLYQKWAYPVRSHNLQAQTTDNDSSNNTNTNNNNNNTNNNNNNTNNNNNNAKIANDQNDKAEGSSSNQTQRETPTGTETHTNIDSTVRVRGEQSLRQRQK